jgi:response regulator RpfG family c-di-GMP phosphodiesterase
MPGRLIGGKSRAEGNIMHDTLLYIGSEPAIRQLVRRVLGSAGFRVLEAENLASGRKLAEQARPEIVLLDVDDPDTASAGLLPTFRTSPGMERTVFLASTGDDRPNHTEKLVAWGFQGVLVKPLDIDTLANELKPYLTPKAGPALPAPMLPVSSRHDIRSRWQINFSPIMEGLVRNVDVADGVLALLDEDQTTLVAVAACSIRVAANGARFGARLPLTTADWIRPSLKTGDPTLLNLDTVKPSALLPEDSTAALVVPVTNHGQAYGLLILSERRRGRFVFPPAQVAESIAEAARIALILAEADRLDEAIAQKRQEMHRFRLDAGRAVAIAGRAAAGVNGDRDALVRLTLRLAEQLKLPMVDSLVLREAVEAYDLGRTWIAQAILPHAGLTPAASQHLLEGHADHTTTILSALEWPQPVLDLICAHRAWWSGEGQPDGPKGHDIPLAARIMAVTTTYETLTAGPGPHRGALRSREAIAELTRESGRRFDPDVVGALAALLDEKAGTKEHTL